jgi:hypothetical protein
MRLFEASRLLAGAGAVSSSPSLINLYFLQIACTLLRTCSLEAVEKIPSILWDLWKEVFYEGQKVCDSQVLRVICSPYSFTLPPIPDLTTLWPTKTQTPFCP